MTVLLATSGGLPAGEPGAAALDSALRARGIDHAWARWDDAAIDWSAADLVAVRSSAPTARCPSTSSAAR